jgi:hypothetical protein
MIYSTDRILTTHAESLPRPDAVREMVLAKARGEPIDQVAFDGRLKTSVAEIVKRQIECGLDIVNDGELSKSNFTDYVLERITGCENRPGTGRRRLDIIARDERKFAGYFAAHPRSASSLGRTLPVCTGELCYVGQNELKRDIDNFSAALAGLTVAGAYLPANTPGTIEHWMTNEHSQTTRRSCSRSPKRCAPNTRRSSTPAFCCKSTIRIYRTAGTDCPTSRWRTTANTRRRGSTRSITHCAIFRRKRSDCMSAGAASTGRITTTFY